jgi:hypothetical protein
LHRLGLALIAIGLLLLASPLYLPTAATVYLVDPNQVWIIPRGYTSSRPAVLTSTTPVFDGLIQQSTSSWSLPGSCSTYEAQVGIFDGSTLVKTFSWARGEIRVDPEWPGPGTRCVLPGKTVTGLSTDRLYVAFYTLKVYDSSGTFLGDINNPDGFWFKITNVPSVQWYINNRQAGINSRMVVTVPVTFKMVVTSGDPSIITGVKIDVYRGSSVITTVTLSKTSTSEWSVTWNTNERGELRLVGYFYINNDLTNPITTLNTILDFGGGGGGGGGLQGLTPLQLVGLLSLLAGMALVVMRRER